MDSAEIVVGGLSFLSSFSVAVVMAGAAVATVAVVEAAAVAAAVEAVAVNKLIYR